MVIVLSRLKFGEPIWELICSNDLQLSLLLRLSELVHPKLA